MDRTDFTKEKFNFSQVPSFEEMRARISSIENLRDRCLVSFYYCTGARCSEITNGNGNPNHTLRMCDITQRNKDNRDYLVFAIYTEKNRQHPRRLIAIPNNKNYELYATAIMDYVNMRRVELLSVGLKEEAIVLSTLFTISRRHAYRIIRKYLDTYPHALRHIRLSHLAMEGLNALEIQSIAGWSDTKQTGRYLHFDWWNSAKKL